MSGKFPLRECCETHEELQTTTSVALLSVNFAETVLTATEDLRPGRGTMSMNDRSIAAGRGVPMLYNALSVLALLAWLPASAAAAQKSQLFKCVDAAGVTSIQSGPCAQGSTVVWRRDATPEPKPTADQAALAEAKRLRDMQTVRELSDIVERRSRPQPPEPVEAETPKAVEAKALTACESAMEFSGLVRDKQWLALSDDQMQRIYRWVAEQCKATPGASE